MCQGKLGTRHPRGGIQARITLVFIVHICSRLELFLRLCCSGLDFFVFIFVSDWSCFCANDAPDWIFLCSYLFQIGAVFAFMMLQIGFFCVDICFRLELFLRL